MCSIVKSDVNAIYHPSTIIHQLYPLLSPNVAYVEGEIPYKMTNYSVINQPSVITIYHS